MAKYTHSKSGTTVKVDMSDFKQATKDLGLNEAGAVQQYATKRAAERMDKYVPFRGGVLKGDITVEDTQITYKQEYARPMYFGISSAGNPIQYNGAPQRGAFWDEKMIAAEGDEWVAEVQEYSDKFRSE